LAALRVFGRPVTFLAVFFASAVAWARARVTVFFARFTAFRAARAATF